MSLYITHGKFDSIEMKEDYNSKQQLEQTETFSTKNLPKENCVKHT